MKSKLGRTLSIYRNRQLDRLRRYQGGLNLDILRRYQRQNRLDRLRRCRAAIEQIETLEKRLNGSISKREKNYPIMKAKHLIFAMQGLHLIEHGFYELHTDV